MNGAGAEFFQVFQVFFGAVAFVKFKAVLGIEFGHLGYQAVAADFSDNRGGGNKGNKFIGPGQVFLGDGEIGNDLIAVNDDYLRRQFVFYF